MPESLGEEGTFFFFALLVREPNGCTRQAKKMCVPFSQRRDEPEWQQP
jgi:hypothetical protein